MSTQPFNKIREFGASSVYAGDSRDLMRSIADNDGKFRLIFGDPPFGIGVNYDGEFDDGMSAFEYSEFTRTWLWIVPELLPPGGRLVVHVPDRCVYPVLKHADSCGLIMDEWIIWHFRFGQNTRGKFTESKCHGIVFKTEGESVWNPEAVAVETDRSRIYKDARTTKRDDTRNYKHQLEPGQRVPFDVWGGDVDTFADGEVLVGDGKFWGRVPGNSKERRPDHENQLPELYMRRYILAYTNIRDWVLDPFGGSGTTAVVAHALDRHFITCDQSDKYAESIAQRVEKGAVRI